MIITSNCPFKAIIEKLFVKSSTPHIAFSGTSSHAQYLADIGVPPSNIVKRYKVTNNVIDMFPLDVVEDFQTAYPTLAYTSGDEVITSTQAKSRGVKLPRNAQEVSVAPIDMPNQGFVNKR